MKETVTLRVCFAGLVEGEPAQLAFSKRLAQPGGKEKIHSQMVPVADPSLLARLREVKPGEELEITIETDWSAEGVPTVLKGFSCAGERCAADVPPVPKPQRMTARSA